MSKPAMYDPNIALAAGIDPKTGLPLRAAAALKCELKDQIRMELRVLDEQNAVNRYIHRNLPKGLDSRLIERILYYRAQLMIFALGEETDRTYFALPYTLAGAKDTGIDVYGRYRQITPVPFNGTSSGDNPWVAGLTFVPLYDPADTLDPADLNPKVNCVIMRDYTEQISQSSIARQLLNDSLLDVMAECIPFMRTSLINGTGTRGVRVTSEDEISNVTAANDTLAWAALSGRPLVGMTGMQDFQDLATGVVNKADTYMQALQSLDNFRLSLLGCTSGGLFQKHEHTLEAEVEQNGTGAAMVLMDGLRQRQEAWDRFNKLFGTNVTVELADALLDQPEKVDSGDYTEQEAEPQEEPNV